MVQCIIEPRRSQQVFSWLSAQVQKGISVRVQKGTGLE
jgi:hypothetical protein